MALIDPTTSEPPIQTFSIPIVGDDFASYRKVVNSALISTKMIVQIDATGIDSEVVVNFLQSNHLDVAKASLMKDTTEIDIYITLPIGASNSHVLINTWEGLYGYIQIDVQSATAGTIVITNLYEGSN